MAIDLKELVYRSKNFSSTPEIFLKIQEMLEDPDCSVGDLSVLISRDPSLTFRLLKLANSAYFNFPTKIDSLQHAIFIIGSQQLRDLVLATTLISQFQGIGRKWVNPKSFCFHCIACGTGARILAIHRRELNPERFYLAGILHDIGRLLLFENHDQLLGKVMDRHIQTEELLFKIEQEELGFDHAQLGAELCRHWQLPGIFGEMILGHHEPSPEAPHYDEIAILSIADNFAKAMELGTSGDVFVSPLGLQAWDRLGIETSMIPEIWKQIESQSQEAYKIFFSN